jgi:hypothetical protein
MGACHGHDLKCLYCWLHETMRIAGKKLNPNEWILHGTCRGTPMQTYYDCGLHTVLFGLCVAKRYFLKILTRKQIAAAQCFLLLRILDLEPKNAKPLYHGPVGRKYKKWVLYPFHHDGEGLPYDCPKGAKDATDSQSPNKSDDSLVHLKTPPKMSDCQDKD